MVYPWTRRRDIARQAVVFVTTRRSLPTGMAVVRRPLNPNQLPRDADQELCQGTMAPAPSIRETAAQKMSWKCRFSVEASWGPAENQNPVLFSTSTERDVMK